MRDIYRNKLKIVLTLTTVFLLIGVTATSAIQINIKEKNENTRLKTDGDTEFYAVIAACSQYANPANNIPKFPLPPIATWKLTSFYNSLIKTTNWKEENIILLVNENATKQNIIDALVEMSQKVDSDDIFLFSWQGHGSEVPDESPFDEEDHTDEIICPYDITKEDNEIKNYITDDELNKYFSQIHAKGILAVFESCLSGGLAGEEYDVDQDNRVVIVSTLEDTIGRASFLLGFPMTFGLAIACNQKYLFHAPDKNNDGIISAEEMFKWAAPIIYSELSLFWIGQWVYILLSTKDPLSAVISTFVQWILSEVTAYLMSGHFLFNCPHMIDKYPGELPLLEAPKDAEKTPPLPDEIWDEEYGISWSLLDKKYWPKLLVEANTEKKESGMVNFYGYACNAPKPYVFEWDFGDGNYAIGRNVTHSYDKKGNYEVTLKVTDKANRTETTTFTINIEKTRQKNIIPVNLFKMFPFLKHFFIFFNKPTLVSS